jgi:hypothetical protein
MTSWTKPTADQLDRAIAMLTQAQFYRRFFEGLKNPLWIEPLREKGLFTSPPTAEHNAERGTIGFRAWPASEFLVRMAVEAPDTVTETILGIPYTDNFWVHESYVEAALLLPPALGARIAEKEIQWMQQQGKLFTLYPDTLGKLCVHLATGQQIEVALKLFAMLMEVSAVPAAKDKHEGIDCNVTARFDVWHYRDIIKKHLPQLVIPLGIPVLKVFCDLLTTYLNAKERGRSDSGRDYSCIWRPAIESHSQNMEGQLGSVLVSGCRDAAELLAQAKLTSLDDILGVLTAQKWLIFRRLAIHLVRKYAATNSQQLQAYFTDRVLFEEIGARHEYALLLRERCEDLPDDVVDTVFRLIETGPDVEEWKKEEESSGKYPNDEDCRRYVQIWQRERLAWFQDRIPVRWSAHFADTLTKIPAPEHADFPCYMSTSWVGPESPKSPEEIKLLSIPELIVFLRAWTPPARSFMEPTREGLARVLGDVVKEKSCDYAQEAKAFIGLDPTYVRAVIRGFEEALKTNSKLFADNILHLCEWAVQQASLPKTRGNDEDPDWSWTHKTIAGFLQLALQKKTIPISKRKQVWDILFPITNDSNPSPKDEPDETPENSMGPETISINTARGQAMHAVIHYALWVRRHIERDPEADIKLKRGLREMPEVLKVLDDHLVLECDPSPAVRSVYGQWFPWLVLIDPVWAQNAVGRIFPTTATADRCKMAAWLTYITFCQPYDNVFEVLQKQYLLGIESLGASTHSKKRYGDPDERIGQHLASYYWRGKVNLESDSLFSQYLVKSSDKMRGSVIAFIGRSLENTKKSVPEAVLSRLQTLWDWMTKSGSIIGTIGTEASASFGWWFTSEKFPDEWTMPRLLAAVERAKIIEPDHMVAEKLVKVASKWPVESIRIFEALAKNDKEGWKISYWADEAMATIETALSSNSPEAKTAAVQLVNYLGSRGYVQFGKILSQGSKL